MFIISFNLNGQYFETFNIRASNYIGYNKHYDYTPCGLSGQLQYYLSRNLYLTTQNILKFDMGHKNDLWEVGVLVGAGYEYKIKTKSRIDNIIYTNMSAGYNFNNILLEPKSTLNYFIEFGYGISTLYKKSIYFGLRFDEIILIDDKNANTINLVITYFYKK